MIKVKYPLSPEARGQFVEAGLSDEAIDLCERAMNLVIAEDQPVVNATSEDGGEAWEALVGNFLRRRSTQSE